GLAPFGSSPGLYRAKGARLDTTVVRGARDVILENQVGRGEKDAVGHFRLALHPELERLLGDAERSGERRRIAGNLRRPSQQPGLEVKHAGRPAQAACPRPVGYRRRRAGFFDVTDLRPAAVTI